MPSLLEYFRVVTKSYVMKSVFTCTTPLVRIGGEKSVFTRTTPLIRTGNLERKLPGIIKKLNLFSGSIKRSCLRRENSDSTNTCFQTVWGEVFLQIQSHIIIWPCCAGRLASLIIGCARLSLDEFSFALACTIIVRTRTSTTPAKTICMECLKRLFICGVVHGMEQLFETGCLGDE